MQAAYRVQLPSRSETQSFLNATGVHSVTTQAGAPAHALMPTRAGRMNVSASADCLRGHYRLCFLLGKPLHLAI